MFLISICSLYPVEVLISRFDLEQGALVKSILVHPVLKYERINFIPYGKETTTKNIS